MISVVSVSNRHEGLKLVSDCLKRQLVEEPVEWLIVSPQEPKADYPHIWIKDPPKGRFWPLNACYQLSLERATGDVFVSIQDFIWFPPDALEKFAFNVRYTKGMVSGVGDIYKDLVGGKPENKVWSDPRKRSDQGSFYECNYIDIEFNFCALPTEKIREVGGFAVELDQLGYDPVNVDMACRLFALGVKPYLDQTNECRGLKHAEHPSDWDENFTTLNGKWKAWSAEKIKERKWPNING